MEYGVAGSQPGDDQSAVDGRSRASRGVIGVGTFRHMPACIRLWKRAGGLAGRPGYYRCGDRGRLAGLFDNNHVHGTYESVLFDEPEPLVDSTPFQEIRCPYTRA